MALCILSDIQIVGSKMITFFSLLTFCMLGNFSLLCCRLLTCFIIDFFKKFFEGHYQSVKQFGSRSGK